jgi:hypothetical protein
MTKYCLVKDGAFVKELPANKNVHWDSTNTLPPKSLTPVQRFEFGVFFFFDAPPIPAHHHKGETSHTIYMDTVTPVIASTPYTAQEIDDAKEAASEAALSTDIVDAIIEWAAPLVGKSKVDARTEIKAKHKAKL